MSLHPTLPTAQAGTRGQTQAPPQILAELRDRIRAMERPTLRATGVHPFGIAALDGHLPEGGLTLGALHEVAGGGPDAIPAAAATLFVAGILGRLSPLKNTQIVWCTTSRDLFPPGLACAGLDPARVLHIAAPNEKTVLLVMEEALRHPGLAAVVGELSRLPMVASRRLTLAAEKSGVMALALHRRPAIQQHRPVQRPPIQLGAPVQLITPVQRQPAHENRAAEQNLSAAATRWCITPHPSPTGPNSLAQSLGGTQTLGPATWHVALTRCRGGEPAEWIMEACNAQGCLSLPSDLEHRQGAAA